MKYTVLKALSALLLINVFTMNNVWSHNVSTKASAFIISPQDDTQLTSPFLVRFGIKHFKITPAGENIHKAGHYHLLIDQTGQLAMDKPIPSDNNHLDFRLGETEVLLTLPPGKHTLQLVVGDEELILSVIAPPHQTYRRLTNRALREIKRVWRRIYAA